MADALSVGCVGAVLADVMAPVATGAPVMKISRSVATDAGGVCSPPGVATGVDVCGAVTDGVRLDVDA